MATASQLNETQWTSNNGQFAIVSHDCSRVYLVKLSVSQNVAARRWWILADISSEISEYFEEKFEWTEDLKLVDRFFDKFITVNDVDTQETKYQGIYHGLITDIDEDFVESELGRLVDVLKDTIKDNTLHIIRSRPDVSKLFGLYQVAFSKQIKWSSKTSLMW